MQTSAELDKLQLASQFINSTSKHVFLTGKAGTGKTTFLHSLAEATYKNYLVVAPTGIAALNAKGVTIHSQFQFPLGSFIPDERNASNLPEFARFYTRHELARRHPLNRARKQVLRQIELLVIDEVSMLRADLLDAIDYRLRSAKRNYKQPFGGVQLLMIGDLMQLPPIVKNQEWEVLKQYYPGIHFFNSIGLKEAGFAYLELDKVYRQKDEEFIQLLNNLRKDQCTADDIKLLNDHYTAEPDDNAITLTTHNALAGKINRDELQKLEGPSYFYDAEIEGDFPEHIYPLEKKIELRPGCRVMFVRNDTESQMYYNGKLATVKELNYEGIQVETDDGLKLWVEQHRWENIRFKMNDEKQEMQEEVIGSFLQYPLRLAWAVTVHKSQGLTFEKAVIDVGRAFAPGQVYVALSRLRSLEGLQLKSKISSSAISSDRKAVAFSHQNQNDERLPEILNSGKREYLSKLLDETFDFKAIIQLLDEIQTKSGSKLEFEDDEMRNTLSDLQIALMKESKNTKTFRQQLLYLLSKNAGEQLMQRIEKGSFYYHELLRGLLKKLFIHIEEVKQLKRTKTYLKYLSELDQLIHQKWVGIREIRELVSAIKRSGKWVNRTDERISQRNELLAEAKAYVEANPKKLSTASGRKKNSTKGETYQITFGLFKEGKSIKEIAKERSLAVTTIEGHIARGIEQGEIEAKEWEGFKKEEFEKVAKAMKEVGDNGLKDLYSHLNGELTYGKLKLYQACVIREKSSS